MIMKIALENRDALLDIEFIWIVCKNAKESSSQNVLAGTQ
jgi:hypothetical protein